MNNLEFFQKELKSCSRCGLCNAVCPIYKLTKNECTSPRGKFILINNFLSKGAKPSKNDRKYIKMCLNCGKCTKHCPSLIDIVKINKAYEKDYFSFNFNFKQISILLLFLYNKLEEIFNKKFELPKNKKFIYQKSYKEEEIPKIIKESNCKILEDCGASIKFAINNPELYKELSIKSARNVLKTNADVVITSNYLCKTQLEAGLNIIKAKMKIIYM